MNVRKIFGLVLPEGETFRYQAIVNDELGVPIDITDPTVFETMLLSLYTKSTGVHIGSRQDQDVLGTAAGEAFATGTLTFTGGVTDGETVTIGADVYEFDTDASVTGGNVLVDVSGGATAPDAVTALVAVIPGTEPVSAVDGAGNTVVVTADVAGTGANSIATLESVANASWGAVTLTGGALDAYPGANDHTLNSNGTIIWKVTSADTATAGTYVARYVYTYLDAATVERTGIHEFEFQVSPLDTIT